VAAADSREMDGLTDPQWEALDQAIFSATPDTLADWLLSSKAGLGERLDGVRWLLERGHVGIVEVAQHGSPPRVLEPDAAFRIIEQVAAGSGAREDLGQRFFLQTRRSGSSLWRREATARRPAKPARVEPWLLEAVSFYRRLGFFESPKPDSAVADWIVRRHNARYRLIQPGPLVLDDPDRHGAYFHDDLAVILFDPRRTRDLEFEANSVAGSTMYEYELARLARISRGVFNPIRITESAAGAEVGGRVTLHVDDQRGMHEFAVSGAHTDWIDWTILWVVQFFLDGSPYRVHVAADPDPSDAIFVTVLTPGERAAIQLKRGLPFSPLPREPGREGQWWWLP
jgi:hypothetical protein